MQFFIGIEYFLLISVLLLGLNLYFSPARYIKILMAATQTFTTPTTIGNGDVTYENDDIICDGTTLTIEGPHTFASLDLRNGCILNHSVGAANKPVLTILGNVIVDGGSNIDLFARGFPSEGGPAPGQDGINNDGGGGGAHGGSGGAGQDTAILGGIFTQASAKQPTEYGSGGGAAHDGVIQCNGFGGAGGGAIRFIVSGTFTHNGTITVNGQNGNFCGASSPDGSGGGAGGSFWLDANVFAGTGTITANGGAGGNNSGVDGGGGGGGRIAIYYNSSTFAGSISSLGGEGNNGRDGGAGTVYEENKSTQSGRGNLTIDNGTHTLLSGTTGLSSTILGGSGNVLSDVIVQNRSGVRVSDAAAFTFSSLLIEDSVFETNGALTLSGLLDLDNVGQLRSIHPGPSSLTVTAATANVDATSFISGDTRGFTSGLGPAVGDSGTNNQGAAGGGHGGNGGRSQSTGINGGAAVENSAKEPTAAGSAGGEAHDGVILCSGFAGAGGGIVKLTVSGTLTNNGTIDANGQNGNFCGAGSADGSGGGAGGSLWVDAGTIDGNGTFSANGGNGGNGSGSDGGGGGGGRVAIYFNTNNFLGTISSLGGDADSGIAGGAGTVYLEDKVNDSGAGDLVIGNGTNDFVSDTTPLSATILGASGAGVISDLTVQSKAAVYFSDNNPYTFSNITMDDARLQLDGAITVTSLIDLDNAADIRSIVPGPSTIDITATDINIDGTSLISGNSRGFASGLGPAVGDSGTNNQSAAGGGHGGRGGRSQSSGINGGDAVENNAKEPTAAGSGGGEAHDGVILCSGFAGAGGGILKLTVSGTLTNEGTIDADGQNGNFCGAGSSEGSGGGAGGSVWIDTNNLAGAGNIRANGGNGGDGTGTDGGGGGGGRVAIYFNNNTLSGTISSLGGDSANGITGGAGTVYLENKGTQAGRGDLIIDNTGRDVVVNNTVLSSTVLAGTGSAINNITVKGNAFPFFSDTSDFTFNNITVDNATLVFNGDITAQGTVDLDNSGSITVNGGSTAELDLTAVNIDIDATSSISGLAKGHPAQTGNGQGTHGPVNQSGGGAGNAGAGGNSQDNNQGGVVVLANPLVPRSQGSGGGGINGVETGFGGAGGSVVKLNVSGTLNNLGDINADGGTGFAGGFDGGGGGAGGSIDIFANSIIGNGSISADGGAAGNSSTDGGGGGGGYVSVRTGSGLITNTLTVVGGNSVSGGNGSSGVVVSSDFGTESYNSLTGIFSGDVTITYTLYDRNPATQNNAKNVFPEFSPDGGLTFFSMTERVGAPSDGITGLTAGAGGTQYTFVWDSNTDVLPASNVSVRIRTLEGGILGSYPSNSFAVSNQAPTTIVLLSSESGTNSEAEDLNIATTPSDPDFDTVFHNYDWRVGGTSFAFLNMPFNQTTVSLAAGQIIDRSTFANHGQRGAGLASQAPVGTASGVLGSAYTFDGTDDYIATPAQFPTGSNPKSFSVWFKPSDLTGVRWIIGGGVGVDTQGFGLFTDVDGKLKFHGNGAASDMVFKTSPTLNNWHHAAITFDGSRVRGYFNGVLEVIKEVSLNTAASNVEIGTHPNLANFFQGSIDEIMFFSKEIQPETVSKLYSNGTARFSSFSRYETLATENWNVSVTPTDGSINGTPVLSNTLSNLTANALPTHGNPLITPNPASTFNTLTVSPQGLVDSTSGQLFLTPSWFLGGNPLANLIYSFNKKETGVGANAVIDYSSLGNHGQLGGGTIANAPTWVGNGKVGGAYYFDGVNDFISSGDVLDAGTGDLTVEAWVTTNILDGNYHHIISKGQSAFPNYQLYLDTTDKLAFSAEFASSQVDDVLASSVTITKGDWYHLVGVRDTTECELRIYVNGSLENTVTPTSCNGDLQNAEPLKIGMGTSGFYWDGFIDEPRIYQRVLTSAQILNQYNSGNGLYTQIVPEETNNGEAWKVQLTVSDSFLDSQTNESLEVTLGEVTGNTGGANPPPINQILITTPPKTPTILEPEAIDPNTIRWHFKDNSDNETGFILETDDGETVIDTGITTVANITFLTEVNLLPETTYCRQVKAKNPNGISGPSEKICFTTPKEIISIDNGGGSGGTTDKDTDDSENDNLPDEETIIFDEEPEEEPIVETPNIPIERPEIPNVEEDVNNEDPRAEEGDSSGGDSVFGGTCPQLEDPVCGGNGITYKNTCFALRSGITEIRQGKCAALIKKEQVVDIRPKEKEGNFFFEDQFGAEVETGIEEEPPLSITGNVSVIDDGLRIAGQTEASVDVTIYVNGFVAYKVLTDETGRWEVDVLHRDVTLDIGEIDYVVEASGKRLVDGVLGNESERAVISELSVFLPLEGEPQVEFDKGLKDLLVEEDSLITSVLGKNVALGLKIAEVILDDAVDFLEDNEEDLRAGLAVSMPVVVLLNPVVFVNFPHLPMLVYHFFSWMAGLIGIKRKKRSWGIVYNSISKNPVPLAIVRLFEVKKISMNGSAQGINVNQEQHLVETQVTDKEGRFGFLSKPGEYFIQIVKPGFVYPSRIMTTDDHIDGDYENLYHRERIVIKESNAQLDLDIPIDPQNPGEKKVSNRKQILWTQIRRGSSWIGYPVLILGWVFSLVITIIQPEFINWVLLGFYSVFTYLQIRLSPKKTKSWGVVFNAETLSPVPLAMVSVVDTKFNKLLKSKLSDYEGRFNFLPPKGRYKLKVMKDGFSFPVKDRKKLYKDKKVKYKSPYFGDEFEVGKDRDVINLDIPLQKLKEEELKKEIKEKSNSVKIQSQKLTETVEKQSSETDDILKAASAKIEDVAGE